MIQAILELRGAPQCQWVGAPGSAQCPKRGQRHPRAGFVVCEDHTRALDEWFARKSP